MMVSLYKTNLKREKNGHISSFRDVFPERINVSNSLVVEQILERHVMVISQSERLRKERTVSELKNI